jgi:hypothetical protein
MATAPSYLPRRGFLETARLDRWWVEPLFVVLALGGFLVYATWAALQGSHYRFGPYLSPFYSPEIFGSEHSWFGPKPAWWPAQIPFSPAILILWVPAGFRFTCFYYRGAYYKAFWADPPSCTVGEPRSKYRGEHTLPLVIQNVHRYFLYLSTLFLGVLASDVWNALWFPDPATGRASFGIGVGTLVLAVNVVLLGGYTFSCHSMRHLAGGRFDRLSRWPVVFTAYRCVSCITQKHMRWAWMSLVWVAFSDLYVRLCSLGVWTDWRLFR